MPVCPAHDAQLAARNTAGNHRVHGLRQADRLIAGSTADSRDALIDFQLKMSGKAKFAALFRPGLSAKMRAMKLCRFKDKQDQICIGLVADDSTLLDLTPAGITELFPLLESENPVAELNQLAKQNLPRVALAEAKLLAPVERQEVWAAGVTYLRSKTARMEESDFSATAYDKVYAAERPEIFFKSLAYKVAATGETVGIRRDARWNVPEPELALVLNSAGKIMGYTIGND